MTKEEEIIEKIKKLQNMTQSRGCSEAEEMNALRQIDLLIERYNIDRGSLHDELHAHVYVLIPNPWPKRIHPISHCLPTLAEYVGVMLCLQTNPLTRSQSFLFFGERNKIDILQYWYDVFLLFGEQKEQEFISSLGKTDRKAVNSYRIGIYDGIRYRLRSIIDERHERQKNYTTENQTALVAVSTKLKTAFDDAFEMTKKPHRLTSPHYDNESIRKGFTDGKNIQMCEAIQ